MQKVSTRTAIVCLCYFEKKGFKAKCFYFSFPFFFVEFRCCFPKAVMMRGERSVLKSDGVVTLLMLPVYLFFLFMGFLRVYSFDL